MENGMRRRLRGRAEGGNVEPGAKERANIVIRARVGRLAAVVAASVMATAMSAGVVTAAPPNWDMTVTRLPEAVTPGAAAGFEVTITNNGPSNISALYLTDNKGETPVYLSSERDGACGPTAPPSGRLFCSFGALTAGDSVTIVVAYATPTSGSSYAITFQANTTGATFSDTKGRSHGDTLTLPVSTALSNNKNFAGIFSTATGNGIFNAPIGGNNKQQAGLQNLPHGVQGTVQDGPTTTGLCTNDPEEGIDCSQFDGEWAIVNVAGGNNVAGGFFVVMKYRNTTDPTAFFHSFGPADDQQILIQECGATPVAPCFTWDGASDTATILTNHNGSMIKR